ncbi:MAG: hypothetical protein HY748_18450 [Elusimicrobia bacterium]|nr:hypothetical protein [Elusimicrobiota bacterium]
MPPPSAGPGKRLFRRLWLLLLAAFCARAAVVWRDLPGRIDEGLEKAQRQLKGNPRSAIWVRSMECGRGHPGVLIACLADGTVVPLEAYWHDDIGVPALGSLLAKGRSRPVDALFLSRFHLGVNAAGALFLHGAILLCGLRRAALAALAAGLVWALPGPFPSPDVSAGFTGIFLLTLAGLLRFTVDPPRGEAWAMAAADALAWLALACAYLLRQNIGIVGLAGSLPWQARLWLKDAAPYSPAWWRCRLLTPALLTVVMIPGAVVRARDGALGMQPTRLMATHGFWHSLVTGLGTEANPWGLQWADGAVFAQVAAADASLDPRSPAYQARACRLYFSSIARRPGSALRIYAKKTFRSLGMPVTVLGVNAFLLTLLSAAGLGWMAAFRRKKTSGPVLVTIAALTLANLLMLAQSVLVIPLPVYFHPVAVSTALLLWLWAERVIFGED